MAQKPKKRYVICPVSELPPGERKIVTVSGRSIGIVNIGGRLYALRNQCPHQGAELCRGLIKEKRVADKPYVPEIVPDEYVVKCPWHGWEFDVETGRSVFNPHRVRVKAYEVDEDIPDEDDVYLETYEVDIQAEMVILYV